MAKSSVSYSAIQVQLERLKKEADSRREQEVAQVVENIGRALSVYDLTLEELFERVKRSIKPRKGTVGQDKLNSAAPFASKPGRKPGSKKSKANPAASRPSSIRYEDGTGKVWTGRGPQPKWLKDLLVSTGRTLESFKV